MHDVSNVSEPYAATSQDDSVSALNGVRAGDYVFVGATTAGTVGERSQTSRPVDQAAVAFGRLELTLGALGSSFDDVVHTRMFLAPEESTALETRGSLFRRSKPAALGFRLNSLTPATANVVLSAIAVNAALPRQRIDDTSEFGRRAAYSRALRVGDHIFITGSTAQATNERPAAPDVEGQIFALAERVTEQLAALGGNLSDVVLIRLYLHDAKNLGVASAACAAAFRGVAPAISIVEVMRFGPPAYHVKLEAEAVVGGNTAAGGVTRLAGGSDSWRDAGSGALVRVGSQCFVGGRFSDSATAAEQAAEILTAIQRDLATVGAALSDVVQMHVYMTNAADAGDVMALLRARLGTVPTPILLPVRTLGRDGALVQIDARVVARTTVQDDLTRE